MAVLSRIQSPAQKLIPGEIDLHDHTWFGHIQYWHEGVPLWQIEDNLGDPDYIALSTTEAGNYLFICEGNTDDMHGDPLVVAVRPLPDGTNIVTTAYYDENYERHQPILWRRGDG